MRVATCASSTSARPVWRTSPPIAPALRPTSSPAAVEQAVCHANPDPSGLDAALDAVIAKALAKDSVDRYASAAEMDADLLRYLENQPVQARHILRKRWIPAV